MQNLTNFLNKKIKLVWSDSQKDKCVIGFLENIEDNLLYVKSDKDSINFVINVQSLISINEFGGQNYGNAEDYQGRS